jgi:hypothetical protein
MSAATPTYPYSPAVDAVKSTRITKRVTVANAAGTVDEQVKLAQKLPKGTRVADYIVDNSTVTTTAGAVTGTLRFYDSTGTVSISAAIDLETGAITRMLTDQMEASKTPRHNMDLEFFIDRDGVNATTGAVGVVNISVELVREDYQ